MNRVLQAVIIVYAVAGLARPCAADPIQIAYLATDLADLIPGEDRWQYEYFVSDFDFDVDQGFSILFDPVLYSNLEDPPPAVNAGWDVITVQPDIVLGSDGFYDALALATGASLADPFVLTFTWLGGPLVTPGSQPLTVNQFDSNGILTVLETGATVPVASAVPEPSTLALVALGAAGAVLRRRRSRRDVPE